ncbi:MAG: histidine kinase N-terminal 7TM domain-containing protein [Halorhabdus sp.]
MIHRTLFVALVLAASGFAAAVVAWLWRRERDLGTNLFLAIGVLQAIGGVLVAAELVVASRSLSIGLYGLENAVLALVTPAFFLFVLSSLGYRRHLTRPVVALVFGIFVVVGLLQATNPLHGLFWSEYVLARSPFTHVVGQPTNLSFLLILPQMIFYYGGMGLLGANALFGSGTRRVQSAALFVGFLPPFVLITVWSMGALPGPINGWSVIGGTWSLGVVAWAVFRHELFDIVPMARETVFEALEEVVIVVDRHRRILDFNRAATEAFPELATAESQRLDAVLPALVESDEPTATAADGDSRGSLDPTAQADGDDGEASFVDSFTRHVDGEPREYDVSVTPISVSDTTGGYAVVIRDVTDRRQRVRHLRQQTAQLERFAETLSHDLRNPLSVARGRIDLARETGDEEHLETAADALERIETLIEDTLTLAREGQAIEDREPVELPDLARNAWETVDTGEATFEIESDAGVTVYADRSRLQTILENLFRNAVEHSSTCPDSQAHEDAGGASSSEPTVADAPGDIAETAEPLLRGEDGSGDGHGTTADERTSEPERTRGSGTSLHVRLGRTQDGFYVEDDGPGIPPADREDVFEYGYTTDEDGTGLGLAIVDAIANAHGWDVTATEGRAGGARIVFEDVDFVETAAHGV